MDATIRNVDEQCYRQLRARAVLEGRNLGELVTEAIRGYLLRIPVKERGISLRALKPEPFPDGNEH